MKCKWNDCNYPARDKSPFCSGTCKKRHQRLQRASGTDVPVEVGQEQVGQIECVPVGPGVLVQVGLDDYYTNPDKYAIRLEPDKLNWGAWIDSEALERAGLKANRVSIPGDWDYSGVGR